MASVRIDSGELPSANGVTEGHELAQVIGRWQSIAHGRFRDDCRFLLQMIEETDRLRLWEKNVGGFTYATRDEFLQNQVLIDYDLTEKQTRQIVDALRGGYRGGIQGAIELARDNPLGEHGGEQGEGEQVDNINSDQGGNIDKTYTLRRLARDRPDLLARVESGELTANAAAIEAGFRRRMRPVPVDSADNAVRALLRIFTADELVRAIGEIVDGRDET